jgi:hypothetical protein
MSSLPHADSGPVMIDLTELSDDESCTKRQRKSTDVCEIVYARVRQIMPDAKMESVRSILSCQPSNISEEDALNRVLDGLFENGKTTHVQQQRSHEEVDRALALAMMAAEDERADETARIMQDEALAVSISKREAEARDRQVAEEMELQGLKDMLQTSRQSLADCKRDAASHPAYTVEEDSGTSRVDIDLLDWLDKCMVQDSAKYKNVQGIKEALICSDVRFFGSSSYAIVSEENENDQKMRDACAKRREGDLGWGCGYRNIQVGCTSRYLMEDHRIKARVQMICFFSVRVFDVVCVVCPQNACMQVSVYVCMYGVQVYVCKTQL